MEKRQTAQLNLKMDASLKERFAVHCGLHGHSQRDIVEMLIESWMDSRESHKIHHLDGTECPMSLLITGLQKEVASWLQNPKR